MHWDDEQRVRNINALTRTHIRTHPYARSSYSHSYTHSYTLVHTLVHTLLYTLIFILAYTLLYTIIYTLTRTHTHAHTYHILSHLGSTERRKFIETALYRDAVLQERVFLIFDSNRQGHITFKDYVEGLSKLSNKTSIDTKLRGT